MMLNLNYDGMGDTLKISGTIRDLRIISTFRERKMAFAILSDDERDCHCTFPPKIWAKICPYVEEGKKCSFIASESVNDDKKQFIVTNIDMLYDFMDTKNKTKYINIDGVIYSKDKTVLVGIEESTYNLNVLNVIDGVTMINPRVCVGWMNLETVILPNTLNSIEEGAFGDCRNLKNINLPNSLKKIGNYVFNFCESLSQIQLPESLTEIGDAAFMDCRSLEFLKIPKSVTSISRNLIFNCYSLNEIYIPASITEFDKECFVYSYLKEVKIYGGELSKSAKISLKAAIKKASEDSETIKVIQHENEP